MGQERECRGPEPIRQFMWHNCTPGPVHTQQERQELGQPYRERSCCEAVLLHYIVNLYFLWRPVFTMLYPASNYFLSQFTQRDSWVLRIPLIRQMMPH